MASRYKFSEEEIEQIVTARKANKDKRAEVRLKALELRSCIHERRAPSGRQKLRRSALNFLEIHKVFLRKFALTGDVFARPSGALRL